MDNAQANAKQKDDSLETELTSVNSNPAERDFKKSWDNIDAAAANAKKAVESTPLANDKFTQEMKSMNTETFMNKAEINFGAALASEKEKVDEYFTSAEKMLKDSKWTLEKYLNEWKIKVNEVTKSDPNKVSGIETDFALKIGEMTGDLAKISDTVEATVGGIQEVGDALLEDTGGIEQARETIANAK